MSDAAAEELRHLPRLHYGLAALVAIAAAVLAVPVAAGWQALARPEIYTDAATGDGIGPPSSGGWIFLVGGIALVLAGAALSLALVLTGRAIAARRSHAFCLAISFAATFFFPFGTLLGFHTLNALCAPGAREAFGLGAASASPDPMRR